MSIIDIVGFGALNIDHLYRVDRTVTNGEQLVTDYASSQGGSAANTIYGVARLGIKAGLVGVTGEDEDGQKLIEDFKAAGLDTSQIRAKQGAKTGSAACFSDKHGRRALYISPGANSLLKAEDISLPYLNQAKMVHLSSFADDKQFNLQLELVKEIEASVKVSLAPGMLYAAKGLIFLAPLIEKSHVIFMNREEIEMLTGRDFKSGAQECMSIGCHIVVVTLGKGLSMDKDRTVTGYIRDIEKEYEIESGKEDLETQLETTGAGDAFAAGFLYGLLKGRKIEDSGLLGDIMARFTISEIGARKGLPSLAQLSETYLKRSGHQL